MKVLKRNPSDSLQLPLDNPPLLVRQPAGFILEVGPEFIKLSTPCLDLLLRIL